MRKCVKLICVVWFAKSGGGQEAVGVREVDIHISMFLFGIFHCHEVCVLGSFDLITGPEAFFVSEVGGVKDSAKLKECTDPLGFRPVDACIMAMGIIIGPVRGSRLFSNQVSMLDKVKVVRAKFPQNRENEFPGVRAQLCAMVEEVVRCR